MKRRTSIFGLIAGLMLAGSLLTQSALAQPPESNGGNNSTTVSVTVAGGGIFDAYFCLPNLTGTASTSTSLSTAAVDGGSQPTAATAGLAVGKLAICYTDTKNYRVGFDTQISASAFTGGPSTIPLSGFKVTKTYNVGQIQWSDIVPGVGDIGQYQNQAYVDQSTGPWPWTSLNTLDSPVNLQFGYDGIGTIGSEGDFDVSVALPIGTQDGTYQSTLTISILAGTLP